MVSLPVVVRHELARSSRRSPNRIRRSRYSSRIDRTNHYLIYYHTARTHLSLDKDAPEPRLVEHLDQGRIVETPMVGGLHHRYTRQAA
jgi:hypothetical protein